MEEKMNSSEKILEILLSCIKDSNITEKDCLRACNINNSFFSVWKKQPDQKPSYDKIVSIALYLGLDLNYVFLTQEESNRTFRIYTVNDREDELLKYWRGLSAFDQGLVLGRLQKRD